MSHASLSKTLAVVQGSLVGRIADSIGETLLDCPSADLCRFADRQKADLEILVAVGCTLENPANCLPAGSHGRVPLSHQLHDQKTAGVAYDLFADPG